METFNAHHHMPVPAEEFRVVVANTGLSAREIARQIEFPARLLREILAGKKECPVYLLLAIQRLGSGHSVAGRG